MSASASAEQAAPAQAPTPAAAAAAADITSQSTKMEMDDPPPQQQQQQQPTHDSRRSSSSSPDRSGGGQLRRTVRQLHEDIEEVESEQNALRKQVLWAMAQEVRRQRKEMSTQIVVQGWRPEAEDPNVWQAHRNRNHYLEELFEKLTKLPKDMLSFEASHSTNLDSLSRLSVITMKNTAVTGALLRASHQQRYSYGAATLQIRKQTSLFDRLCSMPAKLTMEALTRRHPELQGSLKPDWRAGEVWTHSGRLVALWEINVEHAVIRAYVDESDVREVEE